MIEYKLFGKGAAIDGSATAMHDCENVDFNAGRNKIYEKNAF